MHINSFELSPQGVIECVVCTFKAYSTASLTKGHVNNLSTSIDERNVGCRPAMLGEQTIK